jgi:signal transduction histidine kinase
VNTRVVVASDDLGDLPAAVEVAAYRIAGEAVTNAVRHAEATYVDVALSRDAAALHLEVRDDGTGLPAVPRPAGVGLTSMRLRAEELGGTLTFESPPPAEARGTLMRAMLPVASDATTTLVPALEEAAP